jgi:hypothetical protein
VKENLGSGKEGGNFTERNKEWQKKTKVYVRSKEIWREGKKCVTVGRLKPVTKWSTITSQFSLIVRGYLPVISLC